MAIWRQAKTGVPNSKRRMPALFDIIAITEQNHRLKRIYAKMSMQNARLQKALGKQR
jgi:hypothetical protein